MKTALITGACGFCARRLIERLQNEGIRIVGIDRLESPPLALDEYHSADLSQPDAIARIVASAKPDRVFHLAGTAQGSPSDLYRSNLMGTVYLLEALREQAPEAQTLLIGSAAEYGIVSPEDLPLKEDHPCRPVTAYGISKHAMTLAGLDYARRGLKVAIARPFNIVGVGVPPSLFLGALISRLKAALELEEPAIKVGNLDSQRDFLALDDAIDGYLGILESESWGEIFNLCAGRAVPMRLLLEELLALIGRPVRVETDPALLRTSDVPLIFGSFEKARSRFGFEPKIGLREAIAEAWRKQTA